MAKRDSMTFAVAKEIIKLEGGKCEIKKLHYLMYLIQGWNLTYTGSTMFGSNILAVTEGILIEDLVELFQQLPTNTLVITTTDFDRLVFQTQKGITQHG